MGKKGEGKFREEKKDEFNLGNIKFELETSLEHTRGEFLQTVLYIIIDRSVTELNETFATWQEQ